ncbi:F0F1 ATP synthase subunit gamma [Azospirillum rugosum]|uniref:ATP synthase gamma chain n=1 Tax=Azospirillum rugosum TaxID=416170 RepID=A0ABS4SRN7_9PROT|nr:F0F1 ATP synthase subunit gamma [Azospirillum rugosum]MBP2295220.1 F-type H+-transporting ATPase subunit gamma [Azospirillum rugosum]MDQ0528594.1 F-type H+-transporting ATPase subunit gamma [Azospirillum rugosum]
MPSLKDLKNRISSVQSTRKITSAMKMVAASKLRRAQEQAEAGRPYAERMGRMLASLAANVQDSGNGPKLMTGTGADQVHLLIIISSDRGLCGAFNGSIVRESRRQIQRLQSEGKTVKLLTVGRKARDQLRREFGALIVETYEDVGRRRLSFADADVIAQKVLSLFDAGEFDVCSVIYNKFKSAISQIVTVQQLVPFAVEAQAEEAASADAKAIYEFEPDEEQILAELLPRNLSIQVYRALLESAASEQGARMTAMDNATRNAGDMINKLTITYNRTRQAYITKELIEIISGAEAV